MYLCEKINPYIMLQVQRICKEKGLTMQEAASRLGITYQSLYDSIKGNPTLKRLQDIANALDVEVSELFAPKEDFIAFVRVNGETQTFTRMFDLLYWIHGIERADNLDQ